MEVDYIVVGAGSAGCAVAARLSERVSVTVALLRARRHRRQSEHSIPAAFPALFNSLQDWAYHSEPMAALGDRSDYLPRGKVLGGSSSMELRYDRKRNPPSGTAAPTGNNGVSGRSDLGNGFVSSRRREIAPWRRRPIE